MFALQRETARVIVASDPDTERWVRWRGQHFFEQVRLADDLGDWRVAGGLEFAPPAKDYVAGGDAGFVLSISQQTIAIDAVPGPWRALHTLRAVRHLLRWTLLAESSALFLHGAAIAERETGRGFCILGPRRAGKSMLSYELLGRGFDWISQDDLCLVPRERTWSVLGWPGSLRLRRDALDYFPDLRAHEARLTHPANPVEASNPSTDARLHIFPEELSEHRKCGIRGEATVSAFFALDPNLDDDACRPISPTELRKALFSAWDILPERRAGTGVADALQGKVTWAEIVFNPQLLELFGMPSLVALSTRIDALADTVPAWRVGRRALLAPGFVASKL